MRKRGDYSEEKGKDSEHEWSKECLTFEYMVAHEPFTALPVHYCKTRTPIKSKQRMYRVRTISVGSRSD